MVLGDPARNHYSAYNPFVEEIVENQAQEYALVRKHLKMRAERNKKGYDVRVRSNSFRVSTWVLYFSPRKYIGRSPKCSGTMAVPI